VGAAPRVSAEAAQAARSSAAPAPGQRAAERDPAVAAAPGTTAGTASGGVAAAPGAPRSGGAPPAAAAATATETSADAAAVLRRAEKAYDAIRSLEADFSQDLTVPLLDTTQRSRGKMYIRRPDRFLMKFTDPAGDIVVADGRHLWLYYPSSDAKQVVRASVAEAGQQVDLQKEFLSNPTARFHAVQNGTESIAGRSAHVLTLTPKAAAPYRQVRIWVDTEDALVRRFEITEQNESVRRLELRNLRPNAAVADQLFRFTPPPGTQVFTQ